jgi:hypothetical protein
MARFTGRSFDKIKIPSKHISQGFKIWVFAQAGYVFCVFYYRKGSGPINVPIHPELKNETATVVYMFLSRLPKPPPKHHYIVWLDNLFTSTKLLIFLRKHGIGGTGTARKGSGINVEYTEWEKQEQKRDKAP